MIVAAFMHDGALALCKEMLKILVSTSANWLAQVYHYPQHPIWICSFAGIHSLQYISHLVFMQLGVRVRGPAGRGCRVRSIHLIEELNILFAHYQLLSSVVT